MTISAISRKKSFIPLILALAMALCFAFAGNVQAAPVPYTGQPDTGNYTISTAAQLAELAAKVNETPDGNNYSGSIFTLLDNIHLENSDTYGALSWTGGTAWTPIGGACPISGGVPTGNYFAGIFDGQNHTVSGISITSAPSGYGAYGLFGFVNGGALINLKTAGAITINTPVISVGGIVGYAYGGIDNCHNEVSITLSDDTSTTSMCGGVAGTVENTTANPIKVQRSSNTAAIQGRGRVGGIVGAVYCTSPGGVNVNNCFNSGAVTTISFTNAHSGGVVGYCRGYIEHCYNTGNIFSPNDGHYIAGVVGLLQGSNPQAYLKYSYSTGEVEDIGAGYCQALFASTDNSTTMPITNCFWLDTLAVGQSTSSGWGNCVNVAAVTDAQLKGNDVYSGTDYVVDYLNNFVTGDKPYSQTAGSYPTLTWQAAPFIASATGVTPGSVGQDTDDLAMIFLDGTAATNGSGTKPSPFNNMTSALGAVTASRNVIYINGQVTLSSAAGAWSAPVGISSLTVKRSSTYSGYLVEVAEGGSLTLEDITVDGNKHTASNPDGIVTACNALFNVTRSTYDGTPGSLTINSGAKLQNSYANSGAAVRISGANATLNGGSLINNDALTNGGAVAVYRWIDSSSLIKRARPGSFTFTSGAIYSNSASNYGGAVYMGAGNNVLAMDGGTIGGSRTGSENSAVCGGGVYLDSNAIFNLNHGTITGNSAVNGKGVYLGTANAMFNLTPAADIDFGSGAIINDVYLYYGSVNDYAKINVCDTLSVMDDDSVKVTSSNLSVNRIVVVGSGYQLDSFADEGIVYADGHTLLVDDTNNNIYVSN